MSSPFGNEGLAPRAGHATGRRVYDLSPRVPSIALEEGGFHVHSRPGRSGAPLQDYGDLTHVAATARGFWLGTRRGMFFARRQRFRLPDGPERLLDDLMRRIARAPGGIRQLERMAEIDHRARHPRRRRATVGVALLCVAVYALQLSDPFVEEIGSFMPSLFSAGQWWRIVTANFIHGLVSFPVHLIFNLLGLVAFGALVEKALGSARVVAVLAASGIAAMGACLLTGIDQVVGASGMVAGLVGAALCLELHFADRMPAWWRLPRRPFVLLIGLQVVIDAMVPLIAGEAHIGGFLAGYAVTWATAAAAFDAPADRPAIRRFAAGLVALAGLAFVAAAPLWLRSPAALERHGRQVLAVPDLPPNHYNDLAWRMATESDLSTAELRVAVDLAERAVNETGRMDPDLLDTLAEVFFAVGDRERAVETIEEAIALSPQDDYFHEQRRRFTGERDADDRPVPPMVPWMFRQPPELGPEDPHDEDGVAI